MALTYASQSGELTNLLGSADRVWWQRNAMPTAVSNNGILFGMSLIDGGPATSPKNQAIQQKDRVEGQQLLLRHMAELETFSGVADANQADAASITLNANAFGGQLFDWGHFSSRKTLPSSENTLIRGEAAHGLSWREELMGQMKESWYDFLDTGMMSTSAGTRSAVAGLRGLVVDTGTIGGINYATAGNEGFQSTVVTETNLTYDTIIDLKLRMVEKGAFSGSVNWGVGVAGRTPYKKLLTEALGYHLFNDDRWKQFANADRIGFLNIMFCFDHKGSDTDLFVGDPRAARLYLDAAGPTARGPLPVYDVADAGMMIFLFNYFCQFVVYSRWWGRVQSITG